MAMLASTKVLVAGPLPPGPAGMRVAVSVSRVRDTPPTVMVTDALAVTSPADGEVNVTVHVPAEVPGLAQVLVEMLNAAPLALVSVTAGLVPLGAFTNPAPPPAFCLTVTVNVCGAPTSLVAV